MDVPQLLLCDLDGTLAVKWKPDLLPGRQEEIARIDRPVAIVTNQGGVHVRWAWENRGEPERVRNYPTIEEIQERVIAVSQAVPQVRRAYVALYVGHTGYELPDPADDVILTLPNGVHFHASWSREWRKPNPGMLQQALHDFDVATEDALMLGDSDDDKNAAARVGVPFIRVSDDLWEPGMLGAVP
ncbi:MAG: HAD hydrolase-like protein [Candidatus Promineifilaceae bacterium]|nr:HAD hydrolase-like protein [Candidatus Promineifilaceae bacterium]